MKKLFSLCLICLLAMSAIAQRAAVMEFKAGVGISQADVDGISGIFTTYFRPAGYTMIERTQIDRIIEEQRLQRSALTESQMVRVGQLLNLSKIVIGDVNVVMGQYNVDVRVINVESGTIAATEGATFAGSSYRDVMKTIAQKLAGQIAISAGPTIGSQSTPSSLTPKTRTKVETVYGYLHVFPNELGVFQSIPTNVISNINNQGMHGYDEWRVPTNEELSLLHANGYLSGAQYMTKENASGMVLLVTTGKCIAEKEVQKTLNNHIQIPNVPLKNIDGYNIQTSKISNNNKPIIIAFWATWCKPAIRELNAIHRVYPNWQQNTGVKMIIVNIDQDQDINRIKQMVNGYGWEYDVWLDSSGYFKNAMKVQNIPHLFILDREGKIVLEHIGYTDGCEQQFYNVLCDAL